MNKITYIAHIRRKSALLTESHPKKRGISMKKILTTMALLLTHALYATDDGIKLQAIDNGGNAFTIVISSTEDLANLQLSTPGKILRFEKQDSEDSTQSVYQLEQDITFDQTRILSLYSDDFTSDSLRIMISKNTEGQIQATIMNTDTTTAPVKANPSQATSNPPRTEIRSVQPQAQAGTNNSGYNSEAQAIAQRRANMMAQVGRMSHFGGGVFQTAMGTLYEGIGMATGGGMPNTCQGSGPAVADATAYGRDGAIYRVRLYTTPTSRPNGGGVLGNSGRRGLFRR
jgi:hypothetical protein